MTRSNLNIAILQNYSRAEAGGELMIENISKLALKLRPSAEIKVHAPIDGDEFPDLNTYDLVILTGGPFNLLQEEKPSWVTDTLDYIKGATTHPAKSKLLGICWGHQAIALALGGSLGEYKNRLCFGIATLPLTPGGETFFNAKSLDIHKNHKIVVNDIGPQLSCISPDNEILLSKNNQMITFQGHPEMDEALARSFMDINDPAYSVLPEPGSGMKNIDAAHDGESAFARILEWVEKDKLLG